jgi:hypothetical protein
MPFIRFAAENGSQTRGAWVVDEAKTLVAGRGSSGPLELVAIPTTKGAVCYLLHAPRIGDATGCTASISLSRPYSIMTMPGTSGGTVFAGLAPPEVTTIVIEDDPKAFVRLDHNGFIAESTRTPARLVATTDDGRSFSISDGPPE